LGSARNFIKPSQSRMQMAPVEQHQMRDSPSGILAPRFSFVFRSVRDRLAAPPQFTELTFPRTSLQILSPSLPRIKQSLVIAAQSK
jgi:hypothetical protein